MSDVRRRWCRADVQRAVGLPIVRLHKTRLADAAELRNVVGSLLDVLSLMR